MPNSKEELAVKPRTDTANIHQRQPLRKDKGNLSRNIWYSTTQPDNSPEDKDWKDKKHSDIPGKDSEHLQYNRLLLVWRVGDDGANWLKDKKVIWVVIFDELSLLEYYLYRAEYQSRIYDSCWKVLIVSFS